MTTHDKDKIIAAAKESGITYSGTTPEIFDSQDMLTSFYAIAFEAGRQAEREECAQILEKQDVDPSFKHRMADAIRAGGEGKFMNLG